MHNEKRDKKSKTQILTVKKLKEFKGFENICDDEANEILNTYDLFSSIMFKSFQKQILK